MQSFYVLVNKALRLFFYAPAVASPSYRHKLSPTLSPLLFIAAGTLVLQFCGVTSNAVLWTAWTPPFLNIRYEAVDIKNLHLFFLGSDILLVS